MTTDRIQELRAQARIHEKTHRSARIILECLDELEKTNHLYCIALDYGFGSFRGKAIAINKLKDLVKT
jgi:hypothetical protein